MDFSINSKNVFLRGSHIYGTANENSDIDVYVVLEDSDQESLIKWGTIEEDGYAHSVIMDKMDIVAMTESQFKKGLEDHDIAFLESVWVTESPVFFKQPVPNNYEVNIDNWKLRQSISELINNSWAKCHKKLTVEEDYNLYIGQKSLFHVLRIINYGTQIAKTGKIHDYTCSEFKIADYDNLKALYDEIMNAETPTWEYYKEKYQPLRNALLTEFKKYCPKPVEK